MIDQEISKLKYYPIWGWLIVSWLVKIIEEGFDLSFAFLGVYPRSLSGLRGILFFPFLHKDFQHLFSNSLSYIVLGGIIFYFFEKSAKKVVFFIFGVHGLLTWLIGREAYHIGASGMVYGFAAFVFFQGVFNKNVKQQSLALVVAFLYGGMIYGLFPNNPEMSFEGHIAGAVTGLFASFIYKDFNTQEVKKEVNHQFGLGDGYQNLEGENFIYVFKPSDKDQPNKPSKKS